MDLKDHEAMQSLKKKTPQTLDDIKHILGFLSYYCSFIEDFSRIAIPVYELLKVKQDASTVQPHQKKTKGPQLSSKTLWIGLVSVKKPLSTSLTVTPTPQSLLTLILAYHSSYTQMHLNRDSVLYFISARMVSSE